MREYLHRFFERFAYPHPAREALLRAYDTVQSDAHAQAQFDTYLAQYRQSMHCDFEAQARGCREMSEQMPLSPFTLHLLLFLCHTQQLQEWYRQAGLDEQLWYDTVSDLKYKLLECHAVYGVWGATCTDWLFGFFTLERFALGRLQFEWGQLKYPYQGQGVSLAPGARVVQVHIPRSGQPLSAALCDDAFARAAAFFTPQLQKGEPFVFCCSSWLLYPPNQQILPPASNILAFMNRFDVFHTQTYDADHPDLWRLFDTMEKNPDRLAADSSVRRAYIAHLKSGGKTGRGYGVMVVDK